MIDNKLEKKIQKILEKIDNYEQTLLAIICFSHVLRWDDNINRYKSNSYSFIARKMDTSNDNPITPNEVVTPDLVVQLNNNHGIVTEAKKSFPKNRNFWNRNINQLLKYDDNLQGWKTNNELIPISDIVLLTHNKIKVNVSDYIEERINNNTLNFSRKFALLAFQRAQNRKIYLSLEKGFGHLSNSELDERFRVSVRVPLEKVIPMSPIKFYDDKPKLPYIMDILWNNVFTQYPQLEEFMESAGVRIMIIRVNIHKITQQLKTQFTDYIEGDSRQPSLPKTKWIREAMDMFVKLNYANKIGNDEYIVKYKNLHQPIEKFTREIYQPKFKTLDNFIEN